jgi:hypothetical protein
MRKPFVFAPLLLLGFVALAIAGGYVVSLLWNWLLPPIFGWRTITAWQGLGLLALCRILFGGFGGGRGSHRGGWNRRNRADRERWHRKMAERFGDPSAPSSAQSTLML